MNEPTYAFVTISTVKPGRLDDLAALASRPSEQMEGKVPGMLARQVGVDRDRNSPTSTSRSPTRCTAASARPVQGRRSRSGTR